MKKTPASQRAPLWLILAIFASGALRALAADVSTSVLVLMIPDAPTNVSASAPSPTSIDLSWTDNSSNEDGFLIERRVPGGSFAFLAQVGANIVNYTDNSVSPDTAYFYRVEATLGSSVSVFSPEAGVSTPAISVPPSPGGGGGGGGGGGIAPQPVQNTSTSSASQNLPDLNTPPEERRRLAIAAVDLNADQKVNIVDLSILLYHFNKPYTPTYDLNRDGKINIVDLSILLYYWNK